MADDRQRGVAQRQAAADSEIQAAVPRETGGREVRIGIFVIIGILSAIAVLFVLTDPATLRGRYMIVTSLENAGGIRKQDPVTMRGVNVGRINDFQMVGDRVNIVLEIEGAWDVPADSYTRLAGAGLFGGRTMEIIPGKSSMPVVEGDTIPSVGEASGILGAAEEAGTQANALLGQLNKLFADPTITAVQGTAGQLQTLTAELRAAVAAQNAAFGQLTASLQRSATAIEGAAAATPEAARAAAGAAARADSTLAQLQITTRTLDHSIALLDSILARLESGQGTLGLLTRDDALYRNLTRAAEEVALLTADIRANPGKYVRIRIF
jgi:phospholipid/cholesterol/gamma-HCH transport system substrate-binding protein